MKGLLMLLKAFGLSDEEIEKMRIFIPQVPTVAQNLVNGVNNSIAEFDKRLKALEAGQKEILEAFNESIRSRELRRTSDTPGVDSGADSRAGNSGSGGDSNGAIGAGAGAGRRRAR